MVDKRHTRGVALHTFSFGLAQEWRLSMPKILSLFIQTLKNKDEQNPSKLTQSGDVSGNGVLLCCAIDACSGVFFPALFMGCTRYDFPVLAWATFVFVAPVLQCLLFESTLR